MRMPANARSKPNPAPNIASNTLSVRNWRVRRERLAPSARRSAISFCRTAARASRRLATLAHAMRRTTRQPRAKREAPVLCPQQSVRGAGRPPRLFACCKRDIAARVERQCFHLGLGLFQRDARFQARDYFEEMISPLRGFLLWKCDRHPELIASGCVARQLHKARHDSDNRVTFAVQRECAADHTGIGAETPLPE